MLKNKNVSPKRFPKLCQKNIKKLRSQKIQNKLQNKYQALRLHVQKPKIKLKTKINWNLNKPKGGSKKCSKKSEAWPNQNFPKIQQ